MEALELFRKSIEEGTPFSVVLLDQTRPGRDEYEVAERIRRFARKDQPVIVILSSAPDLVDAASLKKLGIERSLIKPLRRATLLEAIRHGLKLPAPVEKSPAPRAEMEKARGLRLLLVEDNRVNQKLATRLLEKMGQQVTLAINAGLARGMLKPNFFDLS